MHPCHDRRRAGGGRPCGNADVDGRRRLLAANQIGATTCIIAYLDDDDQPHVMYNPRLLQALGAFKAVEGCLSLEADSKVTRFDRIKVGYSELVDGELKPRKKDFNGWTAQIIQHGIDHCKGKLV